MKLPSEFLRLATPSTTGRVEAKAWLEIEKLSGPLPEEYKLILSAIGHGTYGCFVFIHPNAEEDSLNLHRAQKYGVSQLSDWCPEVLQMIGTDNPLILGYGPERHILVCVSGVYWLIDTELEQPHKLGRSIAEWLVHEFTLAVANLDGQEFGNSIWSTGSGMPQCFFRPYANPQ